MATQRSSLFFALNLLLLLFHCSFSLTIEKLDFDYIFQIGDSISDTGNIRWDTPANSCDNFPYGMSLDGGTPRRCSDGLLMIDYFAKFFNLSFIPYLEKRAKFNHGVNFAVAGATALDFSILKAKGIPVSFTNSSLSVQLKWFESHLNSMCNDMIECKKTVLRKALMFLGEIGGNDYNYALIMHKSMEDLYRMVPNVIQAIKYAMKELINLGTVTLIVPGIFPIGCTPVYLVAFQTNDTTMYDNFKCVKDLNRFARFHNHRLQKAIKELQEEYLHVNIVYADCYSAFTWVLKNAPTLGFDKDGVQMACCGLGANDYNFNKTTFCGGEGVPFCADPSKRMNWDGVHLTQHAYFHMSQWLLHHIVPNILQVADKQVEYE